MKRNDLIIMAALIGTIVLVVDFSGPMQFLDIAIVTLAAVWIGLTVVKWMKNRKS